MAGAVTSVDDDVCKGWVCIEGNVNYPATVHLVSGERIVASTIADRQGEFAGEGDSPSYGHFVFELKGSAGDALADASILVGETGETFAVRSGSRTSLRPLVREQPFRSYREALSMGASREDVVAGFYLDILGRPVDPDGLASSLDSIEECVDLDRLRRGLFESEEYAQRRVRVSEAAGRLFERPLLLRTSRRAVAFEQLSDPFLVSNEPFWTRIVRFFPALTLRPAAMAALADDVHEGLPERELFFCALAALADRPSLLVDPTFLISNERTSAAAYRRQEVEDSSVSCRSPFFASGWHAADTGPPGRWMAQIGIVTNPRPRQALDRIVVTVEAEFGPVGFVRAFSQNAPLQASFVDRGQDKSLVVTAEGGGAFSADYLLLLTEQAACPWSFVDRPDDRQITLNVSRVEFRASEATS